MAKANLNTSSDASTSRQLLHVAESAQQYPTVGGGTYATVPVHDHHENYPIHSAEFRNWLMSRFYRESKTIPNERSLKEAQDFLDASARLSEVDPVTVHTRMAYSDGSIYLDLANQRWEVVKIGPPGWSIQEQSDVKFRRPKNMASLPVPSSGGSIDLLRPFVNLPNEESWRLLIAWLIGVLQARGPYPVLVLFGEQGSAKSTLARLIRALLDPVIDGPIRSLPRGEQDLAIAMHNSSVLVYDNVSVLPPHLSDSFCRVSTGSGFSTRKLYTDDGEMIFGGARALCLNGIEEFTDRPDLLSRAITLHLPSITDSKRRDEETFWKEFDRVKPLILGALLDAIARGLRDYDSVKLDRMPRMADFAKRVVACESALPWSAGKFMEAYSANRDEAIEVGLDASPVAPLVRRLAEERKSWCGTATELLRVLNGFHGAEERTYSSWPKNANNLSNRLRRDEPNLRKVGVELTFNIRNGKQGERLIEVKLVTPANQPG